MKRYTEWLTEETGGTRLENVTLMLNGTKLTVECGDGKGFDLELHEDQATDLQDQMDKCMEDTPEGEEMGGMDDQTPAPPQNMRPGLGEGKVSPCPKCKKMKCQCPKKCSGIM
jgi:hypothetical protein